MTNYTGNLIAKFERNAHYANANSMKRYMRNQFDYFGIKMPLRRRLVTDFIKTNGLPTKQELEKVILELWDQQQRECVYTAIEILAKTKKDWKVGQIKLFEKLALKKSWWDSVDGIEGYLIGPYFKIFPEKIKSVTGKWNASKNIWLQRLSLLFQLMYKEKTDEKLLYKYIQNLKNSEEFFVQKAIGWSLRQYARTNPKSVKKFVAKVTLKPLSFREAMKYL